MTSWVRDLKSNRLVRSEPNPELEYGPEPKPELQLKEMAQERPLNDIFYPPVTTFPSCFNEPDLGPSVTFELRPHYTP